MCSDLHAMWKGGGASACISTVEGVYSLLLTFFPTAPGREGICSFWGGRRKVPHHFTFLQRRCSFLTYTFYVGTTIVLPALVMHSLSYLPTYVYVHCSYILYTYHMPSPICAEGVEGSTTTTTRWVMSSTSQEEQWNRQTIPLPCDFVGEGRCLYSYAFPLQEKIHLPTEGRKEGRRRVSPGRLLMSYIIPCLQCIHSNSSDACSPR